MAKDFRAFLDDIKDQLADQDRELEKVLRSKGLTRDNLRALARGEHLPMKKRMELARAAREFEEELKASASPAPSPASPSPNPDPRPQGAAGWIRV